MVTVEIDDKVYEGLKKLQENNKENYPTLKFFTKEIIKDVSEIKFELKM